MQKSISEDSYPAAVLTRAGREASKGEQLTPVETRKKGLKHLGMKTLARVGVVVAMVPAANAVANKISSNPDNITANQSMRLAQSEIKPGSIEAQHQAVDEQTKSEMHTTPWVNTGRNSEGVIMTLPDENGNTVTIPVPDHGAHEPYNTGVDSDGNVIFFNAQGQVPRGIEAAPEVGKLIVGTEPNQEQQP